MNRLIKLLGGFTREEYQTAERSEDGWRARALAAETTVALFKEIMTRERERSERLEKKLVQRSPASSRERERASGPPAMKPVGNSVSSWPRIRRELERQNRVPDRVPTKQEITENPGA